MHFKDKIQKKRYEKPSEKVYAAISSHSEQGFDITNFFSANCIVFCIIPHTTELGIKDLTIHYPLLDYFSYLTIYGDRGDLGEIGKKNATKIMMFLPRYIWAENNSNSFFLQEKDKKFSYCAVFQGKSWNYPNFILKLHVCFRRNFEFGRSIRCR